MDWQGEKGKGKGIMEEEKIESERRRKGLHFVSRDDSIERTERRRRVNAGFKRPHSCRGLCWCARKLLSLEESETPVRWWASRMSCFLSASLVFFSSRLIHGSTRPSKMAMIQRLLEKTASPSLEWPVKMTAAFVGVSSSSQYIFHMAFKAITFVTHVSLALLFYWQPQMWAGSQVQRRITVVSRQWKLFLNHKEDAQTRKKLTKKRNVLLLAGPAI